MKNTFNIIAAAGAVATTIVLAGPLAAGELNPRANTQNLEYGDVLKIRLPLGLCEFEQVIPAYVVDTLRPRRDWPRLVEYMLVNCPELGLPLADTATASTSDTTVDDAGNGAGSGGVIDGETTTDDDGNNGHGNDTDDHDESNPGNG